jgi:hypothetical protein
LGWPGYTTRALATLQLVLCELQYVLQYVEIHTKNESKKLILSFLLQFSVALLQTTTGITIATHGPWLPPAEIAPQRPT